MGAKLTYPQQDVPEDRTYIVTGGNAGIGYQTAKCIAKDGGRVIIACRSEEKAKEAIEKMQSEHQEEVKKKRTDEKAAATKKAAAEKAAADKAAAAEKAAADKAVAAEKAATEKAAAAEKAKAAKAAKASASKEDAKKEEEKKDDEKKDDDKKEDGEAPKEDAAKDDAAKEEIPKEDAPQEETKKEDALKEEEAKPEGDEAVKTEDTPKESEGAADATDSKPTENSVELAPVEEAVPEEPEEPIAPLKVEFMKLDLESFASTMEFVNAYKAKGYPLHVLICNAGFGAGPQKKTDDGHEQHLQVNYLSHFLMTLHLLPLLRESAPNSRIVNVSSVAHSHGVFNIDNMNGEQSYDRLKFYGNSKLYQIMSMYSLTRRLGEESKISVFSVHPGYVDSDFNKGSADSKLHSFMDSLAGTFRMKRSVQDGAMTTLVAALDSSYDEKTALYFKNCKPTNPSALARKVAQQDSLWKFSVEALKDHLTEDLLKDLQLPEPEPEPEPEPKPEESKPDEAAAAEPGAGGDNAKAAEGREEEKKEEPKQVEEGEKSAGGDAPEKKEEAEVEKKEGKEEEVKEEAAKEE